MLSSRDWTRTGTRGELTGRTWSDPDRPSSHVVVLAHGYGEHLGRYEHVADALAAAGAVVHAVDHQGHGRSEGDRAVVPDVEDVVTDLHGVAEQAAEQSPGLPVVLIGHSMGGLIAARYAQRYGTELAALVLSGPLIGAGHPLGGLLELEEIPDAPLDSTTLSRDPEVGRAYVADPLVWHGPWQRPTVEALTRAMQAVQDGPSLGELPTLWVHGADDQLVPVEVTRTGIEVLRGSDLTERVYEGARHEVFNETNSAEVLADVTGWVRDVLARG